MRFISKELVMYVNTSNMIEIAYYIVFTSDVSLILCIYIGSSLEVNLIFYNTWD